jgi:Dyp-type peroxidase family
VEGAPPGPPGLDLDDIQGMALRGYQFPFGRHLVLRVSDPAAARRWLGRIADEVTTVAGLDGRPDHAVNVALSWRGLAALGLPADSLQSFPEEFRQGMAARARRLGDVGESAPDRWEAPLGSSDVHLLVLISALTDAARRATEEQVMAGLAAPGSPVLIYRQDLALLPDEHGTPVPIEHFGFRDGIGQPAIKGSGLDTVAGQGVFEAGSWRPLNTGEFVLGHPDETGSTPALPVPAELGFNGTYLVWRKLHQHVARFRAFLQQAADNEDERRLIAAKMLGRWPSGAPLALAREHDDPHLAGDASQNNNFTYAEDVKGQGCPVGAHIRRMNPRAGLIGPEGRSVHRHRLLRQGLPYGTRLAPGGDDGTDRGSVIILINADIGRQFEFVQSVWMNDGGFADLGDEKDPLLGNHDAAGSFTIPRAVPPRKRLTGVPAFVSTRGGEYFFLPGRRALGALARPTPVEGAGDT